MAVRRNQSGKWMVDIRFKTSEGRPDRVRIVSPVQTRRGAEEYERQVRREVLAGTFGLEPELPPAPVPTIAEFAHDYVEVYAKNNNKPSEVWSKQSTLKHHILPYFGAKGLDQVKMRDVERFKAQQRRKGLKAKTINNHLTILNRMFGVAVEWEIIEHGPKVKLLKTKLPPFDFLDFREAERFLAGAKAEESTWRTMAVVAIKTGLRQSELLGLQWDDLDLAVGLLRVVRSRYKGVESTPKNGKSRDIPLGDNVLAALRDHRHLASDYVFCDDDGEPLTRGKCNWPIYRTCTRAGLRRFHWHVPRHTFASHLVMRGAPLKAVQELMGHSTIEMTMRYAHLSPNVKRGVVRLLDEEIPAVAGHYLGISVPKNEKKAS